MNKQDEIINALVNQKVIDLAQLKILRQKVSESGKSLEEVMVDEKIVDSEEISKIKSEIFKFPYLNLQDKEIEEQTVKTISKEVARNYRIVCFDKKDGVIKVGIVDPDNFKAIEAVDFLAKRGGLRVQYFVISPESFEYAVKQYKALNSELKTALDKKNKEEDKKEEDDSNQKLNVEEVTTSAPVAKIVSVIIRHAVDGGASDIHIEPASNQSRVRYRIDGLLHTSLILPIKVHSAIVARIKVLANLKLDETRIPQDGRIRMMVGKKQIDFRVSILPLVGSEKVVMRILDTTKKAPTLKDLGYQGEALRKIEENIKKTEGMLLVTGPTGSGKSTTLFSILSMLNTETVNIATLEDPVEYSLKGANQSQVKPEIGYTFAAGLRSFLRQDPDIIMVGEIRDNETAELAIHAALTGHFVLSTVHTTSAIGTISRLVDMDIEPFLLGSSLKCIIAQRLARKICSKCRGVEEVPDDAKERFFHMLEDVPKEYIENIIPGYDPKKIEFKKGKGCSHCGNTGYHGRISICEVIDINKILKEEIAGGKQFYRVDEIKKNQKFVTIQEDGLIKVMQGLTTIEEVIRVAAE